MSQAFVVKIETIIKAPVAKVWEALTKPALIKQYFFGTEVRTDWQVGSSITYRGEWKGKAYEDKGKILKVEPGKTLVTTYWSSMAGLPDIPENYKTVTYELAANGSNTRLILTQDNNASQAEADHTSQNWGIVLGKLKELLEKQSAGWE